mmetsp:Transcript_68523/g.179629  ORF Transcript_68523/g.179629 Transcript_68523/m.179629 type:complete len:731 (-) Transcript_68523:267-2459(-)
MLHAPLAPLLLLPVPLRREGASGAAGVAGLLSEDLLGRRRRVLLPPGAAVVLLRVLEHLDVALAHVLAVQDLLHDGDVRAAGQDHDGLAGGLPVALHDHPDGVPVLRHALDDVVLAEEGVDILLRGAEGQASQAHRRRGARQLRGRLVLLLAPLACRHLLPEGPHGPHLLGQGREHRVHREHARRACARGCAGRGGGRGAGADVQAAAAAEGAGVGRAEGPGTACALPGRRPAEVHVRRALLVRPPLGPLAPHHIRGRAGAGAPEVHGHARGARPVLWRRHRPRRPVVVPRHGAAKGPALEAGVVGRLRRAAVLRRIVGSEGLRRAPVAGCGDALGRAIVGARRPVKQLEGRADLGAHGHVVVVLEGGRGVPRVGVVVRDVADAAGGWASSALVAAVLLLTVREVGGQVAVVLAALLQRGQVRDALAALGAVHRELVGVLREEVLQPLVRLLQVQAGALRERDAEHAQQELALPRRVHVLAALGDDVLLGDAHGLDVLVVVGEAAVRRRSLLEAQLVRALSEQEDLDVAILAALRRGRGAGHLHDLHVLLVARRPGGDRRLELHPRKAGGAAVAVQHELHGVLVLQVGAVRGGEEGLDVRHGRAVRQAAQLHGGLVGLVLLLLPQVELRDCARPLRRAGGPRLTVAGGRAVLSGGLRVGGLRRGAEQQRDALLAGLAGHLEELRVLLEPAPQAALLLHAVPQGPREQGAEVAEEEGVPLALPQELHQLRE